MVEVTNRQSWDDRVAEGRARRNVVPLEDLARVDTGVQAGAPIELEWYMAFSLMVTLIWLYVTLLRLLAILSRNR